MTVDVSERRWPPYREALWVTLARNGVIALAVGAALTRGRGGVVGWLLASTLLLWPALGGHYVDVGFLNGLRPRLPPTRAAQQVARLLVWFVGGVALGVGLWLSATALARASGRGWLVSKTRAAWWVYGLALVGIELVAHVGLRLRGRPNFYDGRG